MSHETMSKNMALMEPESCACGGSFVPVVEYVRGIRRERVTCDACGKDRQLGDAACMVYGARLRRPLKRLLVQAGYGPPLDASDSYVALRALCREHGLIGGSSRPAKGGSSHEA